MSQLPVPSFFKEKNAGKWDYRPDHAALIAAASDWRRQHDIKPSSGDRTRIHVLSIDNQLDFCHPDGTLYVAGRSGTGAIDDSARIAAWTYRNLARITEISDTLDTHFPIQIFYATMWLGPNGETLQPHSLIVPDKSHTGKPEDARLLNMDLAGNVIYEGVVPNPAISQWLCNSNYEWLRKQVAFYAWQLVNDGKYTLYLWPPHCMLGSAGHASVGVIHEAHAFHSYCRLIQSWKEVKGGNPLTENFSVLKPEVLLRWDGQPLAQKNVSFIKKLISSDIVVVHGQAGSHCVRSSIDDLLDEIMAADPNLARKVYILRDCTSAVTVPDGKGGLAADFTPQMEAAMQKFADAGMNLVDSTIPIEDWPNVSLSKAA
jgi:nicotinamidase-related amidase